MTNNKDDEQNEPKAPAPAEPMAVGGSARAAILARRARFVAAALSASGLVGCAQSEKDDVSSTNPLGEGGGASMAPTSSNDGQMGDDDVPVAPTPCLTPPKPPTTVAPTPCLEPPVPGPEIAPTPCLSLPAPEPVPEPDVAPTPCLSAPLPIPPPPTALDAGVGDAGVSDAGPAGGAGGAANSGGAANGGSGAASSAGEGFEVEPTPCLSPPAFEEDL